MTKPNALLEVQGVSRAFGGLKAVQNVSLQVPQGSLTALIGPNGAGKTTLFALLSGFLTPDTGRVIFKGQDITGQAPHLNAKLGMTRTFQIVQPFAAQTVRENIAVGAHLHTASREHALATAEQVALRVGLADQLNKLASDLTVAGRKRLELARALASKPQLLLLDEPACGLNHEELQSLGEMIRDIRDRLNVTVLLVEHHMGLVMGISDRVVALNFGKKIAEGTPAQVRQHPEVIRAYLGESEEATS